MDMEHLPSITGSVPSLTAIPPGCPFHPRCPHHKAGVCDQGGPPSLTDLGGGHTAACYRIEDLAAK
jgi:oligopeptide/dipeptide ABC transporter ATP-binding protein